MSTTYVRKRDDSKADPEEGWESFKINAAMPGSAGTATIQHISALLLDAADPGSLDHGDTVWVHKLLLNRANQRRQQQDALHRHFGVRPIVYRERGGTLFAYDQATRTVRDIDTGAETIISTETLHLYPHSSHSVVRLINFAQFDWTDPIPNGPSRFGFTWDAVSFAVHFFSIWNTAVVDNLVSPQDEGDIKVALVRLACNNETADAARNALQNCRGNVGAAIGELHGNPADLKIPAELLARAEQITFQGEDTTVRSAHGFY